MSKWKWIAVAVFALVTICPSVKAQCSPNPCYTANPPIVTRMTLAQAAGKGLVTATITVTANDESGNPLPGAVPSHNLTVTVGTVVGIKWSSNNADSLHRYYTVDNDPTQHLDGYVFGLSGDINYWAKMQSQNVGHTFHIYVPDSGPNGTSQDLVNITTVAGNGPSIFSQDGLPENTILHFHASGGGGSMLNDFTECQAGQIHQCINATHTPFTTLTVNNTTSGETQFHSKHVSGNTASANQQVGFGDDMFLSALPEDVFEYTEGDEVDCSVFGPIGVGPVHMDIRFERAITEEYISSILNSNGMHPEHIYCIIAATPPDFPGADEALPGTPSGQVVNIAFLYREWPAGTQEQGTPWNLVFPDIQEVGIGYYVKTTMEPDPSGCTMWDNGFRHLPLPTPLDPQPQ